MYFGEEIKSNNNSDKGNSKIKDSDNNRSNNDMNVGKKRKRSPVERLWEDIEKGI